MVEIHIKELLQKNNHSKYWLSNKMDITMHNLNRIIDRQTDSISFKYLELFCKYLNCTPGELLTIEPDKNKKNENKQNAV